MVETPLPEVAGLSAQPAGKSQIPEIIANFTHRIRSVGRCAKDYVQLAKKASDEWQSAFLEKVRLSAQQESAGTMSVFIDRLVLEEFTYHVAIPHSEILSQSLLIFGFSAFDAFVGLLLVRLYREQPLLIYGIEEKAIKVNDLVNCKDLDEAIDKIIERDVSSLLRTSYDDQFATLAKRHGISTLKQFPNWPNFIEAAQRRNLITHCNGVVNSQYINACKASGFALPERQSSPEGPAAKSGRGLP